jgi:hypothetical protein
MVEALAHTCIPNIMAEGFTVPAQSLDVYFGRDPQISQLPSTFFSISYLLITLTFDVL